VRYRILDDSLTTIYEFFGRRWWRRIRNVNGLKSKDAGGVHPRASLDPFGSAPQPGPVPLTFERAKTKAAAGSVWHNHAIYGHFVHCWHYFLTTLNLH
jgi:hypothetical protein